MKTRGFANEDPMTLIKNGEFEDNSEPEIDYGNGYNYKNMNMTNMVIDTENMTNLERNI